MRLRVVQCLCVAAFALPWLFAALPVMAGDVDRPPVDYRPPADAVESQVVARPTKTLGKATVLMVGEVVVGRRRYYNNGKLQEEQLYRAGKLHGPNRIWCENGQLAAEYIYSDGVLHGVSRFWDKAGKAIGVSEMRNGTGIFRAYYAQGNLEEECPLEDGKKHGVCRNWYESGALSSDETYSHGEWHGPRRAYYQDGRLYFEEGYYQGKQHGAFYVWDTKGKLLEEATHYYVHGKEVTKEEYLDKMQTDPSLPKPRP